MSRYARQHVLPDFGEAGQQRLAQSHVAIVGIGALGCALADHLARAGVGRMTLIDRDVVDATNLQRQCLFTEDDAARALPKAEAALARVRAINTAVRVEAHAADLHAGNAESLLGLPGDAPRVLLDGSDNFATRYLLNDLSVKHAIPYAYAGVVATRAAQATFVPGGACLRCVFPESPGPGAEPTCETAGVLGAVVAIVAGAQAVDALKLLLGRGDLLSGTMLEFDAWKNQRRRVDLSSAKDPACPCCGLGRFEHLEGPHAADDAAICGQDAVQVWPRAGRDASGPEHQREPLSLAALAARVAPIAGTERSRFMLRITPRELVQGRPSMRLTVFPDGRAIVHGTTDPRVARAAYAKYVGE
jgi:adenylyltransferase/sulfurtransferase